MLIMVELGSDKITLSGVKVLIYKGMKIKNASQLRGIFVCEMESFSRIIRSIRHQYG